MADYRHAKVFKTSTEAKLAKEGYLGDDFWWLIADEERRAKSLINQALQLKENSSDRHAANLRHARLYENIELDSLSGGDYADGIVRQALRGRGLVRMNVIAACEDTLAAKISKNKPRAEFLTSGGSWKNQMKARKLNKFSRGLFYELNFYEVAKDVFMDACTFGTGIAFLRKGMSGRIEMERVLPDEIYVDDEDARYAKPSMLMRRKLVSRAALLAMFPDKTDQIVGADEPEETLNVRGAGVTRQPIVEVWEAWHLPTKKGAKDGKHCIATAAGELFCEDWKLDEFPFIVLRYKKRTVGFWGKGVAESLVGIQLELNRLFTSVSEQLRRKGRGQIFVQKGSQVNPAHLRNEIGDIVMYTGAPPIVNAVNAVAPEEFMQIERLYRAAFQEVGISELSAASKKPSGLDAAVALREFSDIESERFALTHQAWENFVLDGNKLALSLIKHEYGSKGYIAKMPSKRNVIDIDWKDIDLPLDEYIIQMFPTSSLPQTPAARYQKVKELLQDGFIDKATAQRLLEFPDVEAEQNLGNAAIDDVDYTISMILDEATPKLLPIEPYQNLDLLLTRGTAAYLLARHYADIEQVRLDLLRDLIDQASAMKEAALPPPMVPGAGMAPPAGAAPAGGDMTVNVDNGGPAPLVPPVLAQ